MEFGISLYCTWSFICTLRAFDPTLVGFSSLFPSHDFSHISDGYAQMRDLLPLALHRPLDGTPRQRQHLQRSWCINVGLSILLQLWYARRRYCRSQMILRNWIRALRCIKSLMVALIPATNITNELAAVCCVNGTVLALKACPYNLCFKL